MSLTIDLIAPRVTIPLRTHRNAEARPLMVEKTRLRLVGLVEWAIAAGAVIGLLAAGAVVYGDFRTVRPVVRVIAGSASHPIVPAGVRPGAVSVPLLVLPDGQTVKVGALASSLNRL